jgi:hypothetical protein
MGYEIEACAMVAYQGIKQRVSVPFRDVFTYPTKFTSETCATGETRAEARTNLGQEINDYCQSTFIKCKSHRVTGDVTYTKVKTWSLLSFFSNFPHYDMRQRF